MITVPELAAEALGSFLTTHMRSQIWIDARASLIEGLESGGPSRSRMDR